MDRKLIKPVSINILLIYVGPLPNYFQLFLKSCERNPTIQWTLLTSLPIEIDLPPNVSRLPFSLEDFKGRVHDILELDPAIDRPYKLCDFRPVYGMLYPEIFAGYDFWGHCDADVVFGDIRSILRDELFHDEIKVQMRGSLSFYRNNEEGNRLFQLPHADIHYREVLENPKNCAFDEWEGIYKLMRRNGIPFSSTNSVAEIAVNRRDLRLRHRPNFDQQIFTWEDGKILRTAWDAQGEHVDEYAYIHLQKRPLELNTSCFTNISLPASTKAIRKAYFSKCSSKTRHQVIMENSCFAFLPNGIVALSSSKHKKLLPKLNTRSYSWEVLYNLKRVSNYFKTSRVADRRFYRIPHD